MILIDQPEIKKIDYIINICARHCISKYFDNFRFRCMYDFEMTNGDFVNGKISDEMF